MTSIPRFGLGALFALLVVAFITALTWLNQPLNLPAKDRLVITQWNVQIPTNSALVGAYYTMAGAGYIHIGTHELDGLAESISGCHANINQFYLQRSRSKPPVTINTSSTAINGYYYSQYQPVAPTCASIIKDPASAKRISEIQTALAKAAAQISAAP